MANLIQIKRSTTTATPGSLANGELAITSNGDVLFVGSNGAVLPVGGKRVPGVLTANQALVANATSGIDKIIVANAAVSQLNANGATGTSGQILKSGGAGANSYWADASAVVAGTDTQIQYNDGGTLAGAAGLTFAKASNNVTVANNLSVTANVASNNFTAGANFGGASAGATVNAGTIGVSSNTTVNASVTATQVQVTNSTGTANLTAIDLKIGTSVVNSTVIAAGANVYANVTTLFVGNSTVNASHTSSLLQVSNSTSTANLSAADLKIGATTVVNSTQVTATLVVANVSGSYANITGQVNTSTLYASTSANIASVVQANSTGIWTTATANALNFTAGAGFGGATAGATVNSGTIGISSNTTVNSTHTASLLQVANSTTIANVTAAGIQAYTNSTVNAVVTASLVQVSNSTAVSNLTAQGLSAGANVVANTTTLKVGNTTLTTTNAVFGGTVAANGGIGTAGQLLVSGGASNAYWSNSLGTFQFTDLTVSGNLSVLGDLVTLNVATLAVEDPLIVLAKDQSNTGTYTDAVDIGFFGSYGNTAQKNWAGLFRDQSDSGVFKLFSGNIPEPSTTVDTTNVNFAFATLQTYLKAGGSGATGFIANSTVVNITANSTMSVALVANSLSLSTALPATSGGTGTGTYTSGDILVANTGNALNKLGLGSDGYVLQSNGTALVYNTLDGGSF